MQSTVMLISIFITCQLQSMAPKHPAPKGPKLIHGYTPLIDPEAWLSTMGKMPMSSAWKFVFYPLPHPQIRTFAFYHRLIPAVFFFWMISITELEDASTNSRNRSRLEIQKNFFSNQIVTERNKLPAYVVDAETVVTFKNRLDNCSRWGN